MSVACFQHRRARRSALALVGVVVASTTAGCGGADDVARSAAVNRPVSTPTPSAARQTEARAATAALAKHGALVAGPIDPAAVTAGVSCTARATGADLVDCWFGQGVGGEDPAHFAVRIQTNGTLSKVLGRAAPTAGIKSSQQTASLLDADDDYQHAPSRTRPYECRPSPRIEPSGKTSNAGAPGQLCTTYFRVSRRSVRRYVELAADGTATRDYLIQAG